MMKGKNVHIKFIVVNTIILFVFALIWNAMVHLVILKKQNDALSAIHRADLNDKMWISILVTISICLLFTISYLRWKKNGTIGETLVHSLLFASLMAIIVDLNQYVLYNIPFSTILLWTLFGFCEFIIYGMITYIINNKFINEEIKPVSVDKEACNQK